MSYSPQGYLASKVPEVFQVPKIDFAPLLQMEAAKDKTKAAAKDKAKEKDNEPKSIEGLTGTDIAFNEINNYIDNKRSVLLKQAGGDASLLFGHDDFNMYNAMKENVNSVGTRAAIKRDMDVHIKQSENLKDDKNQISLMDWESKDTAQKQYNDMHIKRNIGELIDFTEQSKNNFDAQGNYSTSYETSILDKTKKVDLDKQYSKTLQAYFGSMGIEDSKSLLQTISNSRMQEGAFGANNLFGIYKSDYSETKGGQEHSTNAAELARRTNFVDGIFTKDSNAIYALKQNMISTATTFDSVEHVMLPRQKIIKDNQLESVPYTKAPEGTVLKNGDIYVPIQSKIKSKELKDKDGNFRDMAINDKSLLDYASRIQMSIDIENEALSHYINKTNDGVKTVEDKTSFNPYDGDTQKSIVAQQELLENGRQESLSELVNEGSSEMAGQREVVKLTSKNTTEELYNYLMAHKSENEQYEGLAAKIKGLPAIPLTIYEKYKDFFGTDVSMLPSGTAIKPNSFVHKRQGLIQRNNYFNQSEDVTQKQIFQQIVGTNDKTLSEYSANNKDVEAHLENYSLINNKYYLNSDLLKRATQNNFSVRDSETGKLRPVNEADKYVVPGVPLRLGYGRVQGVYRDEDTNSPNYGKLQFSSDAKYGNNYAEGFNIEQHFDTPEKKELYVKHHKSKNTQVYIPAIVDHFYGLDSRSKKQEYDKIYAKYGHLDKEGKYSPETQNKVQSNTYSPDYGTGIETNAPIKYIDYNKAITGLFNDHAKEIRGMSGNVNNTAWMKRVPKITENGEVLLSKDEEYDEQGNIIQRTRTFNNYNRKGSIRSDEAEAEAAKAEAIKHKPTPRKKQ